MAINYKCLPLALVLSSLLLASLAVASDVSPEDRRMVEQCRSRCREQQPGGQQRLLCEQRCEQRMRESEGREYGRREEAEEVGVGPRREYQQCRSRCEEQQRQGSQRQQCEQSCEQRLREREREERERRDEEEELNSDISPQREYQQCRVRCQEQQRQGSQRQQCEHSCEQRLREREREERERREEELNSDISPQREYQQCRVRCQERQGSQQQQQCGQRCEQRLREREREARERRDVEVDVENHHRDPERQLRECRQRCQQRRPVQETRRECEQECESKYQEDHGRGRRDQNPTEYSENPYHFTAQSLRSRFRAAEGHLRVLEKLSARSELLEGIENYRLVVLEAAPNTFVVPHHNDADAILVVTRGRGTISIVTQNNKESHNIERSDVVMVRAGSTVYFVNQDNNERLQITKLVTPVNVPGRFEEYYPAGGENPQSYFKAFSSNILKQSLSATEEQIERLVGENRQAQREGERQGVIKRASQEQLRALSQHASTSPRRKGRDTSGPISLRNLSPIYSNDYGNFHQVNPEENRLLEDLDIFVNWCELKSGSIMVPHFNSKATVLVAVVEGSGRMEMACPHLARQRQQQEWGREEETTTTRAGQFEKISTRLSPGDIFIIPAGHPIAVEASESQNLRMVGFGLNARNNERVFIAGKDNMIKRLEREAKELAFNIPGQEVERIFNQPKLSYFVPRDQSEEHRSHPLESILNLAGLA